MIRSSWEITTAPGSRVGTVRRAGEARPPPPRATEELTAPYAPASIKGRILGALAERPHRFGELVAIAHCSPGTAANAISVLRRRGRVLKLTGLRDHGCWALARRGPS